MGSDPNWAHSILHIQLHDRLLPLPSTKLRRIERALRGEERISDGPALLPQVGLSLGSCQGGRGGSSGSGGSALGVVTAERVLVVQECGNCVGGKKIS